MHFQNANVHNEFAQRVCVCVSVCMHAYMYVLMHINVYESGCGARCRGKVCVKKTRYLPRASALCLTF